MTAEPTTTPRASGRRPRGYRHRVAGLVVAALASLGAWAVWHAAVGTDTLRYVDVLALNGAGVEGTGSTWGAVLWSIAQPVVSVVSKKLMLAVLVLTCGLAVYRRRFALAGQLVLLVGGANLTSRYLKSHLDRADLGLEDSVYNSWPSGHTTVAASLSAVLVLAVPRRFRPAAVVFGVLYTTATGVGTMVGGWHRASDVIGGILIVLAWTGLVVALDGTLEPGRSARVAGTTLALLGGAALAAGAMAWVAFDRTLGLGLIEDPSRAQLLVAFGGGTLAVVAVICVTFACFTGLLAMADHDTSAPAPLPAQG